MSECRPLAACAGRGRRRRRIRDAAERSRRRAIPGVGFVGDGTPPDPSNDGYCIDGCAAEQTQCIDACASGGVF